jgi:hypothetical protein
MKDATRIPLPDQDQPLFELGELLIAEDLLRTLMRDCGSESEAKAALDVALHRHQYGSYGGITYSDRMLNDHVLRYPSRSAAAGHHVVSLHAIGRVWVYISTGLGSRQTAIRFDSPLEETCWSKDQRGKGRVIQTS